MSEATETNTATKEKRSVNRKPLDYRVFEVSKEEGSDGKDRLVLIEIDTPDAKKSGAQALLRALKTEIAAGDDSYNGKTLMVVGLSEEITVSVETKRVVSFD